MSISREEFNNKEDLLAKTFFKAASQVIYFHCKAWEYNYYRLRLPFGKFDTLSDRTQEVAFRALILAVDAAVVTAAAYFPVVAGAAVFGLPVVFLVMRAIGSVVQQKGAELGGFSHTRGAFPEKDFSSDRRVKQMTLNVAALAGGLSYGFAGVRPWEQRIGAIVKMIREQDPDVLVLQEVMDTDFANALIKELHKDFAHFFSHLGVSAKFPFAGGFAPGGMFFATKGAVHHFSDHPYQSNGGDQCRSFGCLELRSRPGGEPFARFIGTHPAWKETAKDKTRRALQWQQIKDYIDLKGDTLATFILADTNMEREGEGQTLTSWLEYYYRGKNPTCWHRLPCEWKKDGHFPRTDLNLPRQIDNIAWVKRGIQPKLEGCHLAKAYEDDSSKKDAFDTRTAITDHHGVVVTVCI